MASKKSLDYMYKIAIWCCGDSENANKIRECYNTIADDLEILEILKPYLKIESGYNAIFFESEDTTVMLPLKDNEIKKIGAWLNGKD